MLGADGNEGNEQIAGMDDAGGGQHPFKIVLADGDEVAAEHGED